MRLRLLNLVVRTQELKGAAYQVMLALAWNSSASNECSISLSHLAADAHLTKKSVIRALQILTSPYSATDCRCLLTKVKQGVCAGIPTTYLIDLDLLRDLNRRRKLPPETIDQDPRSSDTQTPGMGSANDGAAGNVATLVEHRETRTLRSQTDQTGAGNSGLSASAGAITLPKREVTRRMRAEAKEEALNIIAMINGEKAIPWMIEQSSEESRENGVPTSAGDELSLEVVGEVTSEDRPACTALVGAPGEQPLFLRRYSPKPRAGVQISPAGNYSSGIRWPRRVR